MAVNIDSLQLSSLTAGGLANLILVNPQRNRGIQAQNAPTLSGVDPGAYTAPRFLFNFEGEQSITLESDITDHFVEDNSAVQDQIALRPLMISTQGFIGEVTDIVPEELQAAKAIADKLSALAPFAPGLSASARNRFNMAAQGYQTANTLTQGAVSSWNSLSGNANATQTKQQIAYGQFMGYRNSRTFFTVQTPWAVFTNMVIQSLRVTQDAETNQMSTFEVTFKEFRFASTITQNQIKLGQGRFNAQSSSLVNLGTSTPIPGPSFSLLGST